MTTTNKKNTADTPLTTINEGGTSGQTATEQLLGFGALNATYRYRGNSDWQMHDVTFAVPAGRIVGLLGPNGSGKTTFMKLLAGWAKPQVGYIGITLDNSENEVATPATPAAETKAKAPTSPTPTKLIPTFNDAQAQPRVFYAFPKLFSGKVKSLLKTQQYHPYFDADIAERYCRDLDVPLNRQLRTLSQGQRTLATAVLALAHRTPILLLDELQNGIDVPTRYKLYELIMEDYANFPRTIVLSTHMVSELETLIEHAVVMKDGTVIFNDDADQLRALAAPLPPGESSPLQYGFLRAIESHI